MSEKFVPLISRKGHLPRVCIQSRKPRLPSHNEALRGFGRTGDQGHFFFFRGTGEQRPKNKGNRGTQAILGNREHRKSRFFFFFGTREQGHFFEGNKGTGTPPPPTPPGRASIIVYQLKMIISDTLTG